MRLEASRFFRQKITDPPHRRDRDARLGRLEALAQARHDGFERIWRDGFVDRINSLLQAAAGHETVMVTQKDFQRRHFTARQFYWPVADAANESVEIQHQIAVLQNGLRPQLWPAQDRSDAGDQFIPVEGFHEIIIGPVVQSVAMR